MNLVEIATIIQEGYKEWQEKNWFSNMSYPEGDNEKKCKEWVMKKVLKHYKGKINPKIAKQLIDMETSVIYAWDVQI